MTRVLTALSGLLILSLLLPANFASANDRLDKLSVVATTGQIGDVVKNIGGDTVEIKTLVKSGVDPHLYQPTRSDVSRLVLADVIFYNGLNLEGKMEGLMEKMQKTKNVVAVSKIVQKNSLISENVEGELTYDPHIWMDIKKWIEVSGIVKTTLSEQNPNHANTYEENYKKYVEQLKTLDQQVRARISSIPENQRILISAHDAFGYFSEAYGIDVIGIQGISTESEAGLSKINALVNLVTEQKIPAIFHESSVGDHNIKAVVEGAAAKGHKVKLAGPLFSDSMGEAKTPEATYIGMMTHNAKTIAKALGGDPNAPLPQIETSAGKEDDQGTTE